MSRFSILMLAVAFCLFTHEANAQDNPKILQHKTWTWGGSKANHAKYNDQVFEVGMGNHPQGFGCGDVGVEIEDVRLLKVAVTAPPVLARLDENSFAGFYVDYHTGHGYTKRVALSIGMHSEKRSATTPIWGKSTKPDQFVSLGKKNEYQLDLKQWAPNGWNGRAWFVVSLQNTGKNTKLTAKVELLNDKIEIAQKPKEEPAKQATDKVNPDKQAKPSSLADRLAGTKWINTNKAIFEWDSAGRLFHNGVAKEYQVVGKDQIRVVYSKDDIGTLVFDTQLLRFDQYYREPTGPILFTGKRVEITEVAQKPKEEPGKKLQPKDDKALLQGRWLAASREFKGKAAPTDVLLKSNESLEVKGDEFRREYQIKDKQVVLVGTLTLRQDASPKMFDFEGKTPTSTVFKMQGIYEVSQDTLRICYTSGTQPLPRPIEFSTAPGNSHYYVVFKKSPDKVEIAQNPGNDTWHELGRLPVRPMPQGRIAISPNGKVIASGGLGTDHRIYVSDLFTGQPLYTLEGHTGDIRGLGFSADSTSLFSGSSDGSVREWDMKTGQTKRLVVEAVLLGGVGIAFKTKDGTIEKIIPGKAADLDGRLKVGDRLVAVSDRDGKMVRFEDVPSEQFSSLMGGEAGTSVTLEAIPNGLQKPRSYELKRTPVQVQNLIEEMVLSNDGSKLVIGCDHRTKQTVVPLVRILETTTGKELFSFKQTQTAYLGTLAVSPDGKMLASPWRTYGKLGTIEHSAAKVWDVATGKELAELKGHKGVVSAATFSPDGRTLATVATDKSVKLWKVPSWEELSGPEDQVLVESPYFAPVMFSPDGQLLAVGGMGNVVHVWDAKNGKKLLAITLPSGKGKGTIGSLAFAPDSSLLAMSSSLDAQVHLWGSERPGSVASHVAKEFKKAGSDPADITWDYFPLPVGQSRIYETEIGVGGTDVTAKNQYKHTYKQGGQIERMQVMIGDVPVSEKEPSWTVRERNGYIEVGATDLKTRTTTWEPVLKLLAKDGDSWEWKHGNEVFTFQLKIGLKHKERPAVQVTKTSRHNGFESITKTIYVRGVGEVEDAVNIAKDGKHFASNVRRLVETAQPVDVGKVQKEEPGVKDNAKNTEPASEYFPHPVGHSRIYQTDMRHPSSPDFTSIIRDKITYKKDGIIEGKIDKIGGQFDGQNVIWFPPGKENLPSHTSTVRQQNGLIEFGTLDVKTKTTSWEPLLKLPAKDGDSWEWKTGNGVLVKYQIKVGLKYKGRPAVQVTKTSGQANGFESVTTKTIYVQGVGEVETTRTYTIKEGKYAGSEVKDVKRLVESTQPFDLGKGPIEEPGVKDNAKTAEIANEYL